MSDWDNEDIAQMEAMDAIRQRALAAENENTRLRAAVEAATTRIDRVLAIIGTGDAAPHYAEALRDVRYILDGSGDTT